jgi:putative acetyltransferase
MEAVILRKATSADMKEMQALYADTINNVCKENYTSEQLTVWAAGAGILERWEQVIAKQLVLLAMHDQRIAGFATLYDSNYIDLFFVHKDYQRQGIAKRLYAEIEQAARADKQKYITSDVSITAKPFFTKMGFTVTQKQQVNVGGVELINFKMSKKLH